MRTAFCRAAVWVSVALIGLVNSGLIKEAPAGERMALHLPGAAVGVVESGMRTLMRPSAALLAS